MDAKEIMNPELEDSRKLFVGGLSWETTNDSLRSYMGRFGNVLECSIKLDPATGRSRGFGFIIFENPEAARQVTSTGPHMVDGKAIDPKIAVSAGKMQNPQAIVSHTTNEITKTLFVGGLTPALTENYLLKYFSTFGKIEQIEIPEGAGSRRQANFAFIEFAEVEALEAAVQAPFQVVNECSVEVRPAFSRDLLYNSRKTTSMTAFTQALTMQQQALASFFAHHLTNDDILAEVEPTNVNKSILNLTFLYQFYVQYIVNEAIKSEGSKKKKLM